MKCIECTEQILGEEVTVRGFVAKTRNLGGMIFIDLRDRSGIVQLCISPENEQYELAKTIRNEFVLEITGIIIERHSKNSHMVTGNIEIAVSSIQVVSQAKTTPMIIAEQTDALEEIRFRYRYLDLRRPNIQKRLLMRHRLNKIIHQFFDQADFIEVETPLLSKSSPEGARDYLVPSRVHTNEFYALPQSPQLYKQLLMLSGIEKYYQIVRCFRDEDLRVDRQPEFTQLDVEQAFVNEEDMYDLMEKLLATIFKEMKDLELQTPFLRMTYQEAMHRFGSDKPDTRFDMELIDLTVLAKQTEFTVFQQAETIKALVVSEGAKFTRKELDKLAEFVQIYQAKGLAWLKVGDNEVTGPIAKFLSQDQSVNLLADTKAQAGDLLLFVADQVDIVHKALGQLRLKIAKDLNLIPDNCYHFLWVTDWPLFEYDEENKRHIAAHHPFTAPKVGQEDLLNTDQQHNATARAYDIVLNGYEIGGGSIRIHDPKLQHQMFKAIGMAESVIESQFGYLLEAYTYGAPIHGGIALGLDRLMMILANTDVISDVIAFPKTLSARDLMMNAPSFVEEGQLEELHLILNNKK